MRVFSILALPMLCAACVTGYHQSSLVGGYSDLQIARNVYQVTARGNGYTSASRVQDMALLRSAELTLENGYRYFGLADANDPIAAQAIAAAQDEAFTPSDEEMTVGNLNTTNSEIDLNPHVMYHMARPNVDNFVVMYREPPTGVGIVLDALEICATVGPRFEVDCLADSATSNAQEN